MFFFRMRRALVVSFLLWSFLILHQVSGVRLKNGFLQVERQSIHNKEEKSSLIKRSNGGFGEVVICKQAHCSRILKTTRSVSKKSSARQRLPSIHEDYYGPRKHKPRHH